MKKNFYLTLALVASMAFSSCNKDENTGDSNVVYKFSASFNLESMTSKEVEETMTAAVKSVFLSAGFSADNFTLELSAPDSATASQIIIDKMTRVENEVKDKFEKGIVTLRVKGSEKKYLGDNNDKNHPISVWYSKEMRKSVVSAGKYPIVYGLLEYEYDHNYQFVKWIRSEEFYFRPWEQSRGDYFILFGVDTNNGAGGDYVYLFLEHSGKAGGNEFVWENQYANSYITDVIGVYGGGEPQTLRIDGRTYKKQNQVADLNKKATGEYVWIYTTSDPMPGYQGYYLITGNWMNDQCCRMLQGGNESAAVNNLNSPYFYNGHRIVERVVQAYDKYGNHKGELNTNYSLNGYLMRLVMTYATKNTGY